MRVLIICLGVMLLPMATSAGVHDDVFKATDACMAKARTLEEGRYCRIKATPRKCRDYLRGPLTEQKSMAMRQVWLKCLGSCEGASLYSRTLGECSTPSDPNK